MKSIKLLDCTLRDGAYITNSMFGEKVIKGIIQNLAAANIDMIEVGWLKNDEHKIGSTYYKYTEDLLRYLPPKKLEGKSYIAMIDYGRYDLKNLAPFDGKSIDAIRVVFPLEKFEEAIEFSKQIKEKGYKLCLQAANTPSYSDSALLKLAEKVNEVMPDSISIVDTFGTMYESDLRHIFMILNNNLDKKIKIGFHSHNNLQLSFALSISLIKLAQEVCRNIIIDCSLCGMGRGAGNTCTELITDYLNKKQNYDYNTNLIMDTIDVYMQKFIENYKWGYSIPFCIAGQLGSHVNNIAYMQKTHKMTYRDMKIVLESLPKNERKLYNYDNLEAAYVSYLNKEVNDSLSLEKLSKNLSRKEILFIAPGKTINTQKNLIDLFISQKNPIIIGINAVSSNFNYDYLFFSNNLRYNYAREQHLEVLKNTKVILTSNIQTSTENENTYIINYNTLMKLGWRYFDNSTIMALRLCSKVGVKAIYFAGFDGYIINSQSGYDDILLQTNLSDEEKIALNKDITDMLEDFIRKDRQHTKLAFITDSMFSKILQEEVYELQI